MRGFGERLGFTPTESEVRSLPDSLPNWLPFPDTVAALGKLKARYQLAIISNVDDDLFAHTARRLEVPFDYLITAQQARAYKPSSADVQTRAATHWSSPQPVAARRPKASTTT